MNTLYSDKRDSGIPLVGDLTWGTDFCQFYQTEKDLLEILVPYFRAGLKNNEFCLWVIPGSPQAEEAKKALIKALPRYEEYAEKGQMEIISQEHWRVRDGKTHGAIVSAIDHAILSGFDGLRLAGEGFPDMREGAAHDLDGIEAISRHNVLAVFLYPRDRFDALSLMDTVKNHRFALVRNNDRWEVIESSEVRTIEHALKRSEEKLHSLFSNMSEGFAYHRIVLDAEGKPCDYVFLEVNEAFEELTGLKREDIIGRQATKILPGIKNDSTDWVGKYGQVALTGKPVQFVSYAEPLEKYYSVSAFSPHKGYFAVTFSDITERKKMERALRESEAKLRVTLRSIGDAVIATDADSRITFMNPVAAHLTGWNEDEAYGQKIEKVFRIINELTRKPAEDIVRRVLREGTISALANHTSLVTRDGREIPIEDSAAPIMDKDGRVSGVVLVFYDVTDQRKAQQELLHAKEEWELTFDTVPDLIAILDNQHRIVRVNRAMAVRLGARPDQCIGLRCYEAVHGMDEIPAFCPHSLTCRDGQQHVAEVNEPRLGGDFLVSTTPLRDRQERVIGSVHVARDITARKQAELELRRAHDELDLRVRERTSELQISNEALRGYAAKLERLNEELQDFAFAAAHDLQEPLRKIQTFCDLIMKRYSPALDGTGQEYLERVVCSAGRMRQLLRDLLQFSKTAAGPEPFQEIDLGQMALEATELFEEDLKISGGRVEIESLPRVKADEGQMLRLFQNLIGNALKFSSQESPRIKIYARHKPGLWEIFVEDNGIGFDPRFADRIFKPFEKLQGRREYEGSGMGLAICHKIVEGHGGSIRAESEPGKGSVFIMTLPEKGKGKIQKLNSNPDGNY